MIRYFLPAGQDFVVKNMAIVAHARKGVELASLGMLVISSTGVFMPLECALNRVWGVSRNRSYLMNQLVAFGLGRSIGVLAMASIAFTAAQHSVLQLLFLGHTRNPVYVFVAHGCSRSPRPWRASCSSSSSTGFCRTAKSPFGRFCPRRSWSDCSGNSPKSPTSGRSLAGFPFGLWPVFDLCEPDDVGLSDRPAAVGGSAFVSFEPCAPSGASGGCRAGAAGPAPGCQS